MFNSIVLIFLSSLFLDHFGWRYALLANCSITACLFLCGALMCPLESFNQQVESFSQVCQTDFEDGLTFIEDDQMTNSSCCTEEFRMDSNFSNSIKVFKNAPFVLFCINNILFFGAMTILWVYLNGYIINGGLGGQSEAGMIYSIIGISNVIGRIFFGILCDHKRVCPVVVYTVGNFFLALNQFYSNYAQTFPGKFIFQFPLQFDH